MDKLEEYRKNAEACGKVAHAADSEPEKKRFQRLAEGWTALADAQFWLDSQPERRARVSNSA
jgi:hypothetical protein